MSALSSSLALALLAGPPAAGVSVDVAPLFAPPDPLGAPDAELHAILAAWTAEPEPAVTGWTLEASGTIQGGFQLDVVSHLVDGERHYAAVRHPALPPGPEGAPVLLVNHGGYAGAPLEYLLALLDPAPSSPCAGYVPGTCVGDSFFVVVPSYRGESLHVAPALWTAGAPGQATWLSEGTPSYLDRDVDDARALLECVLASYPADPRTVLAWGESRGAGVALLHAIRDSRITAVLDFYGTTDLMLPELEPVAQAWADWYLGSGSQGPLGPEPVGDLVFENYVKPYALRPWLDGTLSLADARAELLRRSAVDFPRRLPRLQVHQGAFDSFSSKLYSERLDAVLTAMGASAPCYEFFLYTNTTPLAGHAIWSLPCADQRQEAFLCGALDRAYGQTARYGSGCDPTGGAAPELSVTGCFTDTRDVLFAVDGGASLALVAVGFGAPAALPLPGGCTLLAAPFTATPFLWFTSPAGVIEIPAALTGFPPGTSFATQAVLVELADLSWSLTDGVEVVLE